MTGVLTLGGISVHLRGTAALIALLGTTDAVYPADEVPEHAARPWVTYQVISDPQDYHMGGAAGIRRPLLQVESWADTLLESTRVADAVRTALSGYRGQVGSVFAQGVFLRDSRPGTEDPRDGSQKRRHFVQQDYELFRGS